MKLAILAGAGVVAALLTWLLGRRRHGLSIKTQVFLAVAGICVAVTAAFGALVFDRFVGRANLVAFRAARDDARVVAALAGNSITLLDTSLESGARELEAARLLYAFSRGPHDTRVQIIDPRGRILFDTARPREKGATAAGPEVAAALAGGESAEPQSAGEGRIAAALPIHAKGRVAGVVRVEKPTIGMVEVLSDMGPTIALLAVAFVALAALLAIFIGRGIAGPVERLTLAAERVAGGERQAVLPAPRGSEVRALTEAFESMRRALEQRPALEALAADLSHEVKNSVASVRASAEVIEEAAGDPATVARFSGHIRDAAARLGNLTSELLTLARLEARGIARERAVLDLCEVARAAARSVEPPASARSVRVELKLPHRAPAMGDAGWLERALANLLDNAVGFSPEGATVTLSLAEQGRSWELAVSDRGPGVDDALRARLFSRFVSTRHASGGTGLGLALVRAVAEAHGGEALLRDSGPRGSTFVLRLPRS